MSKERERKEDGDGMTNGNSVAVAMSGGVDSSMAAHYLKNQGLDVFGITGVMWGEGDLDKHEVVKAAQRSCIQMDINHITVDLRERFNEDVLKYFESEYIAGRTPSPCVLCNSFIKFGVLLDAALRKGADRLATGHYVRSRTDKGGLLHLLKGMDKLKDQSYFLFDLDQDQLSRSVFPLGEKTKVEVKKDAAEIELDCRRSKESNELCFIPDNDYVRWIEERSGADVFKPGIIVDDEGRELASHSGIHRYTVGQRKGLGIATGSPMYVSSIDACSGRVVVSRRTRTMSDSMVVTGLNWIAGKPCDEFGSFVKIRYNHEGCACSVLLKDGQAKVCFENPQFAVTPGQVAVFYEGEEVIGGGFISSR